MNLNALIYLLINYFGNEKLVKSLLIANCIDQHNNFNLFNRLFLSGFSVGHISIDENREDISSSVDYLQNFTKGPELLGIYLDSRCNLSKHFIHSASLMFFKLKLSSPRYYSSCHLQKSTLTKRCNHLSENSTFQKCFKFSDIYSIDMSSTKNNTKIKLLKQSRVRSTFRQDLNGWSMRKTIKMRKLRTDFLQKTLVH